MATRPRRTLRGSVPEETGEGAGPEPAGIRRRRARAEPKRPPQAALLVGGGVLLLGVVAFFLLRGGGDERPSSPPLVPSPTSTPALAPQSDLPREGDPASAPAKPADPPQEAPKPVKPVPTGPIDPQVDFPGLDDIQGSAQTYLLADFLALRGKVLTAEEREDALARWQQQRALIEARMAEAAGDPFLEKIDRTRNELAHKPFFADLQYDVIESTRPYALFVEVEGESVTDRDARREQVETVYKPYLEAYDRTIHRYLWKLAPAPPKQDPTFIVFILLDRASYDRFFVEFEGQAASPGMRAHYTWREKWAFTYSPELSNRNDPDFGEGTQSLLHEITHAWVDRLATNNGGVTYDGNLVQTHWFNEGIAEFMSCQFDDGGTIRFQPWKSMRLAKENQRPKAARIPFERAFKIGRHHGLVAEAQAVAAAQREMPPERAVAFALPGFYADMSLFIFWLNFANDGRYKRTFEDYVRKELAGDGGPEVAERIFADVFAMPDLERTVDEFQQAVIGRKVAFEDRDFEVEQ
jgi:hypothetical protein